MNPMFGMLSLSPMEIIILLVIGVLLFGRKLPEVGRYLGKGIVEFKKGMKGLEDEIDTSATLRHEPPAAIEQPRPPQRITTAAPKFEDAPHNVAAPNNITTPPQA
jgi:sec-independent protein translocase protein TatA